MKFIVTKELGRLTKWLRILGFDAVYVKDATRPELIIESLRDDRIILTRGGKMSPVSGVRIIKIRYDNVREQVSQTLQEIGAGVDNAAVFTRCVVCNKKLEDIQKEKIKDKVPEYVYKSQEDFVICPQCKRVYWHGTHWGNVRRYIEDVKRVHRT